MKIIKAFVITLLFVLSLNVYAHPGRTDSQGGHWDHSTGTYHYHTGEYAGRSSSGNSSATINDNFIPSYTPTPKSAAPSADTQDAVQENEDVEGFGKENNSLIDGFLYNCNWLEKILYIIVGLFALLWASAPIVALLDEIIKFICRPFQNSVDDIRYKWTRFKEMKFDNKKISLTQCLYILLAIIILSAIVGFALYQEGYRQKMNKTVVEQRTEAVLEQDEEYQNVKTELESLKEEIEAIQQEFNYRSDEYNDFIEYTENKWVLEQELYNIENMIEEIKFGYENDIDIYDVAYNNGYDRGSEESYSEGYDEGYDSGHSDGYYDGYYDAEE